MLILLCIASAVLVPGTYFVLLSQTGTWIDEAVVSYTPLNQEDRQTIQPIPITLCDSEPVYQQGKIISVNKKYMVCQMAPQPERHKAPCVPHHTPSTPRRWLLSTSSKQSVTTSPQPMT